MMIPCTWRQSNMDCQAIVTTVLKPVFCTVVGWICTVLVLVLVLSYTSACYTGPTFSIFYCVRLPSQLLADQKLLCCSHSTLTGKNHPVIDSRKSQGSAKDRRSIHVWIFNNSMNKGGPDVKPSTPNLPLHVWCKWYLFQHPGNQVSDHTGLVFFVTWARNQVQKSDLMYSLLCLLLLIWVTTHLCTVLSSRGEVNYFSMDHVLPVNTKNNWSLSPSYLYAAS